MGSIFVWTIALLFVVWAPMTKGQCRANTGPVDLVIAVPGSNHVIPENEFSAFEKNLINLLMHFAIQPDEFNIGLILYGKTAIPIATPQPFKTRTQINTRVTLLTERMQYQHELGTKHDVAAALNLMINMFKVPPPGYTGNILRERARRIGIIFTFGSTPAENVDNVIAAATRAKSDGILLYALGSNGTSRDFIELGTDYCRLFSMGEFSDGLPFAMPDLASGICSEVDPTVNITEKNCFPRRYPKAHGIGVSCQVEGNMMQADPNNCAYYYQCEYFDKNPRRMQCSASTLYDPLTKICNALSSVACYNDITCPDDKPALHAHPMDCNKFINCYNDRIPHVQSCPDDQVFDPQTQTCNKTSTACMHQYG
ncbi:uncharacterized protein LOC128229907 isoform X2 [Mya arenaria]|uniref:uncharacterized protein LOC128229907 isoform X2 n=1 Tax=Mya arenaria TaxID=6604 RepID=UPI0022E23352|nr:uncharacterized protein LOC128229907 isoform X2 [Mya arenaria]